MVRVSVRVRVNFFQNIRPNITRPNRIIAVTPDNFPAYNVEDERVVAAYKAGFDKARDVLDKRKDGGYSKEAFSAVLKAGGAHLSDARGFGGMI